MILKKASLTDIIDLQKICIDAYSLNFHHHWEEGGLTWYIDQEFSRERLTADVANSTIDYYFIQYKHSTVGFIKINNNAIIDIPKRRGAELEKIYVLPEYKGKGIGKSALQEIIQIITIQKKKALFLCVIDTNHSAISFYKKLGFNLHSKTRVEIPFFKEALRGMYRMVKELA